MTSQIELDIEFPFLEFSYFCLTFFKVQDMIIALKTKTQYIEID